MRLGVRGWFFDISHRMHSPPFAIEDVSGVIWANEVAARMWRGRAVWAGPICVVTPGRFLWERF